MEMSLGLVCLYVVVDIDLSDRLRNANVLVFDADHLDDVLAPLQEVNGLTTCRSWYFSFRRLKDPTNRHLCPPGHTNFQVMTLAPCGRTARSGVDEGPVGCACPDRREE